METGELTGAWRNTQKTLGAAAGLVTTQMLHVIKCILTCGCPAYFNRKESAKNKEAFLSRGYCPENNEQEDRNGHIATFEDFVGFSSAYARATSHHIIATFEKTETKLGWTNKIICQRNIHERDYLNQ